MQTLLHDTEFRGYCSEYRDQFRYEVNIAARIRDTESAKVTSDTEAWLAAGNVVSEIPTGVGSGFDPSDPKKWLLGANK